MSTMPMMSPKPRAWTSLGDVLRAMSGQPKTARLKVQQVKELVRVGCGSRVSSRIVGRGVAGEGTRRKCSVRQDPPPRLGGHNRQPVTHNPAPATLNFEL